MVFNIYDFLIFLKFSMLKCILILKSYMWNTVLIKNRNSYVQC